MRMHQVTLALLMLFGTSEVALGWTPDRLDLIAETNDKLPIIGCGGDANFDPWGGPPGAWMVMPDVPQSLVATCTWGNSPQHPGGGRAAGQIVSAQCMTYADEASDTLTVSVVSGASDTKGRVRIRVEPGNCDHTQWETQRKVVAMWVVQLLPYSVIITDQVFYSVRCQEYFPAFSVGNKPPLPRSAGKIKYENQTNTAVSALVPDSISKWTYPGEVEFQVGTPAVLIFSELFNPDNPALAHTADLTGYRRIVYNPARLDGDHPNWGADGGPIMPFDWRYSRFVVGAHELGHALLLADNPANEGALMYGALDNYLLWGISGPNGWDWPDVHAAY